jgi:ribosomal subunit interface protein
MYKQQKEAAMQQPIQITFKDLDHSEPLNELIHEKANKLQQFFDNITSCHVVIEQTQKNKHQGKLNNIRIHLGVPGKDIIVNHNENENLFIAVRDAFDSTRRQLEDYARKTKGEVKPQAAIIHGKVVRLFDGFGFIESHDNLEYYFNADNLVHLKFEKLKVGSAVHFIEAVGNEGPQAHHVSAD